MDERQQQIQVGAGLQESRLNTDLIAWLNKYGTWILMVVLVLVVGYVGMKRLDEYRVSSADAALVAYAAARGSQGPDGVPTGSPDSLLAVAREHESIGSVATLARLDAAEIYLAAVRRGLRPGTDINKPTTEDVVTPEQQTAMLVQADELFAQVKSATASRPEQAMINIRARWGLIKTAISRGQLDAARTQLTDLKEAATKFGAIEHVALAESALANMTDAGGSGVLLSNADLFPLPAVSPAEAELQSQLDGSNIQFERMPEGFVPPNIDPSTLPPPPAPPGQQPAPAPAPEQPKPQTP